MPRTLNRPRSSRNEIGSRNDPIPTAGGTNRRNSCSNGKGHHSDHVFPCYIYVTTTMVHCPRQESWGSNSCSTNVDRSKNRFLLLAEFITRLRPPNSFNALVWMGKGGMVTYHLHSYNKVFRWRFLFFFILRASIVRVHK